jgi:signal peptidase I
MQIGFSINEMLFLATLATGGLWVAWRLKLRALRRRGQAPSHKPLWVSFGAELFLVVALMFSCRVALADWPKVPSGSMEPTLRVGDYLLVNHLAYGPRLPFTNTAIETGHPERGDVVVFRYPPDVSQFYVKRLVGLPGDRVAFRDGAVSVNGAAFDVQMLADNAGASGEPAVEDRGQWLLRETAAAPGRTLKINPFVQGRMPLNLKDPSLSANCQSERAGTWQCTVPAGHYLMLGDNRDDSADSRVWGFLPHGQVYGKAVRVLFNLSDLKRAWTAL